MRRSVSAGDWSEAELHRLLEREVDWAREEIEVEIRGCTVLIQGTVKDWAEQQAVEELVSNELDEQAYEIKLELSVDSSRPGASNPPRNPEDEFPSAGSGPSVRRQY